MNFNPYGVWEVTTEGDCEGRSITHLGTFTGYFDVIALNLAKSCYYTLDFKRIDIGNNLVPTKNEVSVRIWEMGNNIKQYEQLLTDRDVYIKESKFFKSVIICTNNPISEEEAEALKARNLLIEKGFDVESIKKYI